MSMKRSKARGTSSREASSSDDFFGKPKPKEKTWGEATEGKGESDFAPYSLAQKLVLGALVSHSKFGKGVVTEVEAQKVNVLFEDGPRKLGHAS
jgi:hypothetical protein